jgi:hypothetical protein
MPFAWLHSALKRCGRGEQSAGDFRSIPIMPDTIDMLAYVPLFALLDDEERAALAGVLEVARFPKGQAIFRRGWRSGAPNRLVDPAESRGGRPPK